MISKEDFNKVWKDSTREAILNQYYYDYMELQKVYSIIKEVREYIKDKYDYVLGDDTFLDHDDLIDRKRMQHILEILDKENKDIELDMLKALNTDLDDDVEMG